MTHQSDFNVMETVLQALNEQGLGHLGEAIRILLNEAMRAERSQVLEAQPYQRSEKRRGYANGYKPKTIDTRMGEMTVQIPQVRGDIDFYPSALERGVRSETFRHSEQSSGEAAFNARGDSLQSPARKN